MIKSYNLLQILNIYIYNLFDYLKHLIILCNCFYVRFSELFSSFQFKWDFSAHLTSEFELACFCVNLQCFLFSIVNFSHTRTVLTPSCFSRRELKFLNVFGSAPSNDHPTSVVIGCHCRVLRNIISHLCVCICLCCACEQSIIAPWFPMTCYNIKYKPLWIIKQVRNEMQHNNRNQRKVLIANDSGFFFIRLQQLNWTLARND